MKKIAAYIYVADGYQPLTLIRPAAEVLLDMERNITKDQASPSLEPVANLLKVDEFLKDEAMADITLTKTVWAVSNHFLLSDQIDMGKMV